MSVSNIQLPDPALHHGIKLKDRLADLDAEAEAATAAGVYAVVVDRPGNALLSEESKETYPVITSLTDLPALS